MTRRNLVAGLALALAMLAAANLWLRPTPKGPNILLIVWDTVRADRLSLYGYDLPTTPRLQGFAKDARVYERAISPAIWTPPSHATLFTGLPPSQHNVSASYKWLDHHHTTLAEHLGTHGYDTYLFSANPYVAPSTNLTQGFETIELTFEGSRKRQARQATTSKLIAADRSTDISPMWKATRGQEAPGQAHAFKDGGPVIVDSFLEWLTGRQTDAPPFFAYLNFMEAHIPRIPNLQSRVQIMDEETLALGLNTDVSQINLLSFIFGKHEYSNDELTAINAVYDSAIVDLDVLLGDLIDRMKQNGLLENTAIILTSDHGENLGEHHMFGHKFSVYDTLLHVPLVLYYPERIGPSRVSEPVSNLDLFATILDLAKVPMPTDATTSTSLLDPNRAESSPVFTEMIEATPVAVRRVNELYGGIDMPFWFRTFKAAEHRGWKFVDANDGCDELYNLFEDPLESTNTISSYPDRAEALSAQLDAWLDSFPSYDPAKQSRHDKPRALEPATKDMLAQLGYLEDDSVPTTPTVPIPNADDWRCRSHFEEATAALPASDEAP